MLVTTNRADVLASPHLTIENGVEPPGSAAALKGRLQIAAHAGVAAAIAAEHAHPREAGMLGGDTLGPLPHLSEHLLGLRPAQQRWR